MNLNDLDIRLQALGWTRIDRRTWSRVGSARSPGQLISLTHGRPADPWELKTLTGTSPVVREYFPTAEDILRAVES